MCKVCEFSSNALTALKKHMKTEHTMDSSKSSSNIQTPLRHSTRNNSLSEALMQEDLTLADITNESNKLALEEEGGRQKLYCPDCNSIFKEKVLLDEHLKTTHGNPKFTCTTCDHEFSEEKNLDTHILTHRQIQHPEKAIEYLDDANENENEIKCPFCDLLSKDKEHLKIHITNTHIEQQLKPSTIEENELLTEKIETCSECEYCNDFSGNAEEMQFHVNKYHDLVSHERSHQTQVTVSICGVCAQGFPNQDDYQKHMSDHCNKQHSCNLCEKVFDGTLEQEWHLQTDHAPQKLFQCAKCAKSTETKEELQVHIQLVHETVKVSIHNQGTNKSCPQCDYKCRLQIQLNNHIKRVHVNPENVNSKNSEQPVHTHDFNLLVEQNLEL